MAQPDSVLCETHHEEMLSISILILNFILSILFKRQEGMFKKVTIFGTLKSSAAAPLVHLQAHATIKKVDSQIP